MTLHLRDLTVLAAFLIAACIPWPDQASAQSWPNEPSGATVHNDYNWGSVPGGGWLCAFGCGSIATDSTAPHSPSSVLRFTLNTTTHVGGGDPYFDHPDSTEIYHAYWLKASNPFQSIGNAVNKISFSWLENRDGQWIVFLSGNPYSNGPYSIAVLLEVGGSGTVVNNCHLGGWGDCPGSYNVYANAGNSGFSLGVWHRIELYGKASSTTSSRDGILKVWLDGNLILNYTQVNTPGRKFSELQFTPTWDGGGALFDVTNTNTWSFDHVHVSSPNGSGGNTKGDTTPPASPVNLRAN